MGPENSTIAEVLCNLWDYNPNDEQDWQEALAESRFWRIDSNNDLIWRD